MSEENYALVRRFIEEFHNKRNPAILDELAPNYAAHLSSGDVGGAEDSQRLGTRLYNGFPDLHTPIDDQIAEGDKVMTRVT